MYSSNLHPTLTISVQHCNKNYKQKKNTLGKPFKNYKETNTAVFKKSVAFQI